MGEELTERVIARSHRVPLPEPAPGDGAAAARQLDAALISAGFKCSRDLFADLCGRTAGQVLDIGVEVLRAARQIAGDHVAHNPYFKDFPHNVPDTLEFWARLIERAQPAGLRCRPAQLPGHARRARGARGIGGGPRHHAAQGRDCATRNRGALP